MEAIVRRLEPADPSDARALIRVQRAAYAVEAELIGSTAIPALHETAADVGASGETMLGREIDGRLVAAVGYRRAGDELDLCRLVVDPSAFRAGHARALLDAVDAAETGVRRTTVSTGRDNEPALRLYEQRGFRRVGEREVAPGLWIAELERP